MWLQYIVAPLALTFPVPEGDFVITAEEPIVDHLLVVEGNEVRIQCANKILLNDGACFKGCEEQAGVCCSIEL